MEHAGMEIRFVSLEVSNGNEKFVKFEGYLIKKKNVSWEEYFDVLRKFLEREYTDGFSSYVGNVRIDEDSYVAHKTLSFLLKKGEWITDEKGNKTDIVYHHIGNFIVQYIDNFSYFGTDKLLEDLENHVGFGS